jgi:hypothetical protein
MALCASSSNGQRWHGSTLATLLEHLHAVHPKERVSPLTLGLIRSHILPHM